MSVATEIERLQGLKSRLRTKLTSMVGTSAAASLSDCVTAVENITENGAITSTISTKAQSVSIAAGYHNGSGSVSIATAEQNKIIAGNIKSGVTILGVEGSVTPQGTLQTKSVTPTTSQQIIKPDSGNVGLSQVTVAAIPSNYADVSDVDAAAGNVLANKKFVTASGVLTTGTMVNNGAVSATINGTTVTSYTIPSGYHNGSGTVTLDSTIETALAAL